MARLLTLRTGGSQFVSWMLQHLGINGAVGVGQKQGAYSISETPLAILLTSLLFLVFVGVQPLEIKKRWKEKVRVGGKRAQSEALHWFSGHVGWPQVAPRFSASYKTQYELFTGTCGMLPLANSMIWDTSSGLNPLPPEADIPVHLTGLLEGQLLLSLTNFPAAHVTHRKLLCLWQATWWERS